MTAWPFTTQASLIDHNRQVRGRFAPSPSGPLHFGSLVAALGSYLHAKSNQGLWFVRIEDIDTTRVVDGAEQLILDALQAFGMQWDLDDSDTSCYKQTDHIARYETVLDYLESRDLVYGCSCTRKQIKTMAGAYDQTCLNKGLSIQDNPIRLKQSAPVYEFEDLHFGPQRCPTEMAEEDYIIKRRDGLFSYQLAVVVDDIDQGITHVVRGADIMPLTPRQISLYKCLGIRPPEFLHLPLAVSAPGQKLSKQNHAAAINIANPKPELIDALSFLGIDTTKFGVQRLHEPDINCQQIVEWAISQWHGSSVSQRVLTSQSAPLEITIK